VCLKRRAGFHLFTEHGPTGAASTGRPSCGNCGRFWVGRTRDYNSPLEVLASPVLTSSAGWLRSAVTAHVEGNKSTPLSCWKVFSFSSFHHSNLFCLNKRISIHVPCSVLLRLILYYILEEVASSPRKDKLLLRWYSLNRMREIFGSNLGRSMDYCDPVFLYFFPPKSLQENSRLVRRLGHEYFVWFCTTFWRKLLRVQERTSCSYGDTLWIVCGRYSVRTLAAASTVLTQFFFCNFPPSPFRKVPD
jgi:hypothetical protein